MRRKAKKAFRFRRNGCYRIEPRCLWPGTTSGQDALIEFDGGTSRGAELLTSGALGEGILMPRAPLLNTEDQDVAIDAYGQGLVLVINLLAADVLERKNRQIGRETGRPSAEGFCFLGRSQRVNTA